MDGKIIWDRQNDRLMRGLKENYGDGKAWHGSGTKNEGHGEKMFWNRIVYLPCQVQNLFL